MVTHYIILSSAYSQGERIALDYTDVSEARAQEMIGVLKEIKKACGEDVSLSIHCIESESADWRSVGKADAFFKGVTLINSVEKFIELIKHDRTLNGLDVAKYILAVQPCTHLKLEKLVYLSYAEYLCQTNGTDKLFNDDIYAYKYGPVTKSVYEAFKGFGYDLIRLENIKATELDDDKTLGRKNVLSARSRILFSDNGLQKAKAIDWVLGYYGAFSAGALIDLTHKKGSPWSHYDSTKSNQKMSDNDIFTFHCNET